MADGLIAGDKLRKGDPVVVRDGKVYLSQKINLEKLLEIISSSMDYHIRVCKGREGFNDGLIFAKAIIESVIEGLKETEDEI